MITIAQLEDAVSYDPETGHLTWRHRPAMPKSWNTRHAGKPAFTNKTHNGYLCGRFSGKILRAHRVAYALLHGYWPEQIDHIDGDRENNRSSNLRNVDTREQARNKKRRSDNKTGVVGVHWSNRDCVYVARCGNKFVGQFKKLEDAILARQAAVAADGSFHINHGREA